MACVTVAVWQVTATASESRKQGDTVLGRHMGSVKPETPKAWSSRRRGSRRQRRRGGEWGRGIPLPSRLGVFGIERRKLPQRGPGRAPAKTILLLSKRVGTPLVATFVQN